MPNRLRAIFLLVTASLLACGAASAQQRWQFMPALAIHAEYEDNVGLVPNDSDLEREADVSVTAVPSAGLLYSTYQTRTLVRLSAAWRYFFIDPDNNNDSYLENLGLDYEHSRWLTSHLQLDWFTRFIYFFSTTDLVEGGDVVIPRQESIVTNAGVGLLQQASMHTSLRYELNFTTSEFESIESDDFITYEGRIELQRAVGQNYNLLFFGGWRRNLFSTDFDLVRSLFDGEYDGPSEFPWDLTDPDDFDVAVVGAGVIYRITPTLSVTIRGGALLPAREEDGIYKLSGLDWTQQVSVEKTFDRIQLSASYNRDISPTRGLNEQVLNQNVDLSLVGEWAENLTNTYGGGYGKYDSEDGTIHFFRGMVGLQYLFLGWIGASLGYEYTDQQSEFGDTTERINDHRVTLSVSLIPPRPDMLRF